MTRILCKFFELYVQDFDLVFEKATDPIDLFCQQNSRDTQRQLLIELNELRTQIFEGKKTLRQ